MQDWVFRLGVEPINCMTLSLGAKYTFHLKTCLVGRKPKNQAVSNIFVQFSSMTCIFVQPLGMKCLT